MVCKNYIEGDVNTPPREVTKISKLTPVPGTFSPLHDRKISLETAKKYGVTGTAERHIYPYYDRDNHHIANKVRNISDKTFFSEGDIKSAGLFGQQLFPPGSAKAITLFEGECDAMAGFEMNGSRYPSVSVKNGASGAVKDVATHFEYLNSFESIVICFDKDDGKVVGESIIYPGQEAAAHVAAMFPIGKVRVLTLREGKDANEYLQKGKTREFTDEWWKAPVFIPSGVKLGKEMWDEIKEPKNFETVSYPFEGVDKYTYGIRLSEFVVINAETGVGKTSFIKEIEHHLLRNSPRGIGFMHFEEPNADTALGLMSIEANKPLHLPDVRKEVTTDELRGYFDATVNNDRCVIWDHFGSNSIHEVLSKVRHMHNLGAKYIIVDHISIIVSDQSGDERKQLDEIATKLKTLCMELNIAVIAIIHQNRQGQIRGTAGVEQLANIVIKLNRNKEDPDEWRRNVTKVTIQKNRFSGMTGPCSYLWYNPTTGRLSELTKEEVARFEAGDSVQGKEDW